ncbi:hypothetical protein SETIT_8G060800v2 [Setaria italica]|uniref:Reverse transcriptase zinc-binding domain-containing protein n=1 Tax=Setaria italica TaxID=4555 RepID=A0A368S4N7_SETIT|nr:hypothetical protein SETIT_8G060800v2 [Setaria italica]
MFFHSTTIRIGDGKQTLFWTDSWIEGRSIAEIAPCLLQAVGPRIRKKRMVYEGLQNRKWVKDIIGAIAVQVLLDYLNI